MFYFGNENDNVVGWTAEQNPSWVIGGGGDDVLFGGVNNAMLDAGSGDDAVFPGGGYNFVYGGPGKDSILSGSGGGDFYGEEGDDTLFVNQGGSLTNIDPNNTLSGAGIVLGFGEAILGDGNNIAVFTIGKNFGGLIQPHPALAGSPIGSMAWGEFTVSINGVTNVVGISPEILSTGNSPITFGTVGGVTLIATALPAAINGTYLPQNDHNQVVDLYIQAVDSQGNVTSIPAGTQISIDSAEIGEFGFDASGQPTLVNKTPVDFPTDFPDTFYTAQVADNFAYDDDTRLKMYYVNADRNQVTYEIENENYQFFGDNGQDTIRFTAPEGEFTQTQEPGGVVYTHTASGNRYYVDQSIENVIFDGWSAIIDPTLFANEITYSVPSNNGSALLSVSGIVDVSKLDPNATEFYVVFEGRVWDGYGVVTEEFRVPIHDWSPDGAFYLNHIEPQILQGPVTLKGILFEDATGEKYQSLQMDAVFGSEDAISQSQIQVEQLDIIFDSESGKPSIVAKGIVENPEYFLSGMVEFPLRVRQVKRL